ncbi:hypothetical protein EDB85DRAFT_1944875 [Lactarius pseudohatsudake]|nr:hypothetical protein EDB85DRAFT_1944875 [Lactarius pseudohatsudake]
MGGRPYQLGGVGTTPRRHHDRPLRFTQASTRECLDRGLYEDSDPEHPKEVAALVEPHPYTLELIHSRLEHHGIPSSSVSTSHGGG